jgi:hypothetical protein
LIGDGHGLKYLAGFNRGGEHAMGKVLVLYDSASGNTGQERLPHDQMQFQDFLDGQLAKAISNGLHDKSDDGWTTAGVDRDTAEFTGACISRWWTEMGKHRFRRATELLITADAGRSNQF